MSEQDSGRLRQAVARLLDAQEDATNAAKRGLEWRREYVAYESSSEANPRLEEALVDVLDILEGSTTDVRRILENDAEEGWGE